MLRPTPGWAVACGLLSCAAPADRPTTPLTPLRFQGPVPTNLLMLSIDTLRKDHVGHHGGGPHTPFLDSLARSAVVVDDAMACSNWTVASTACVLAGASNLDRAAARGMVPMASGAGVLATIPAPEPTLPRTLAEHGGFRSLLVTTNGFFSGAYGNAQGYGMISNRGFGPVAEAWERAQRLLLDDGRMRLPSPWFVHLHFFEPHRPYTPPATYLGGLEGLPVVPFDLGEAEGQRQAVSAVQQGAVDEATAQAIVAHLRVRYAAEVRWLDDQLAVLWRDLQALGLLDDTLVVLWTDHGEELWEHGVTEHGKLLHAEENDALLWFWAHNLEPTTVPGPVHHVDVAPTLLDLWRLPRPTTMTGMRLGRAPADRVRFASSQAYTGPVFSVRQGDHKLQLRVETKAVKVFDVAADPEEQHDRYDPDSALTQRLWGFLRPRLDAVRPYVEADPRGYTLAWPEELP